MYSSYRNLPSFVIKETKGLVGEFGLGLCHVRCVNSLRAPQLDRDDQLKRPGSQLWDWWNYFVGNPTRTEPKWLSRQLRPSRNEILSRTRKYLEDISHHNDDSVLREKIMIFFEHITQHPEARHFALKIGSVDKLLKIRNESQVEDVQQEARKTLAALGHADPPNSQGVRILSIDGGGMRGLAVIYMLKEIERNTKTSIFNSFDLICGVSTGAIMLGCMLPPTSMNLDQVEDTYRDFSTKIFNQNTIIGTARMLWSHGYYDTKIWEDLLKSYVGDTKLIETSKYPSCPKVLAVSTISVQKRVAPFIFRNYGSPKSAYLDYYSSYNRSIYETVRASSAAPTIFEEIQIDGIPHMDGGIVLNNPTALAIREAKNLWPNERISCIVSCGTGLHDPILTMEDLQELSQNSSTSWKGILDNICASATDTEAVHVALSSLLQDSSYFRLNPPLSKYIVMDEVNKNNLSTLIEDTRMYCRRNRKLFEDLAQQLMLPRSHVQLARDKLSILQDTLKTHFRKNI